MKRQAPIASENPNNPFTWDDIEQWFKPVDYSPYYEILNLNEDCTKEDLEKAYKKVRIKYHPDRLDGDKEKFEQTTEAYLKLKELLRY
ncbi:MAG: DnaJ domain-containing protein [Bacteroides sp.]|nr:DnaJ domain-containing protein [Bacteroides sp.]